MAQQKYLFRQGLEMNMVYNDYQSVSAYSESDAWNKLEEIVGCLYNWHLVT